MLREMQMLSLEIAATSMFSIETSALGSELRRMVSKYMNTIGRMSPIDILLPDGVPTLTRARRALFRRRWTRLIHSIIKARRGAGLADGARDLFDLLSEAHGPDDEELLADEVSTMIVAGHETTALTLFWMCTLLAKAPQWQTALATEASGLSGRARARLGGQLGGLERRCPERVVVSVMIRTRSAFARSRVPV
jgi:cytochrome P450